MQTKGFAQPERSDEDARARRNSPHARRVRARTGVGRAEPAMPPFSYTGVHRR